MSEKPQTPKQRLHKTISDAVSRWVESENKSGSIDLKLDLLRMAGDVLFSVQGAIDDKRYEITESAE